MVPEDFITEANDWDSEMRIHREPEYKNTYVIGHIRNKFAPYLVYDFSSLINEKFDVLEFINVNNFLGETFEQTKFAYNVLHQNKAIENVIKDIIKRDRIRLLTGGIEHGIT